MNIERDDGAQNRIATAIANALGEIIRRAINATEVITTPSGRSGATATAARSAAAPPTNGVKASLIAAIGRSTTRDQWTSAPPGGSSRYWRRSNQSWPESKART